VASQPNLERMSVDELWSLHEEICSILTVRIDAEIRVLERRLIQLNGHVEKKRRVDPRIAIMASS
jgi:DNA-binding protein H-NS